jgi:hypothetical protein
MSTKTVEQLSMSDLQKELARRQKVADRLLEKRAEFEERIQALTEELNQLGFTNGSTSTATAPTPTRQTRASAKAPKAPKATTQAPKTAKRASNKSATGGSVTLVDALVQSMEVGATSTPAEMAAMVQSNGYQTSSKNFGIQVANALRLDPRFKRISRGVYEKVSD